MVAARDGGAMSVGPRLLEDGSCEFTFWAPLADTPLLRILSGGGRTVPLEGAGAGYWKARVKNAGAGTRYLFRFGPDADRPDPASHFQPLGVHGASEVVDHRSFNWNDDAWRGIPLAESIIYEMHVGTFTPKGTFDAVIPRLEDLKNIGINAIEIMPVAQFPGNRNWGYDGVYPYAVQNSYGGPEGLKRLVDACHGAGIAVILDVVYNHLGPEGNYLAEFGPYFTDRYKTPWGMALNFDGAHSDRVREYFIGNALHWFEHYHLDGLRLDAVHAITDMSARPFLQELSTRVAAFSKKAGRDYYLIAESDLNDTKTIKPAGSGGHGCDAQWLDDFHHSVHTLLTGEDRGYYSDFGKLEHLANSLRGGFVYTGQYSEYRKRSHGSPSGRMARDKFIVFTKSHDQIGNRMLGERMSSLVSFEALKLHAAVTLLSPFIPMIFMGEEYAEDAPFRYFVSHSDPALIEMVRKGRREEFESFKWKGEAPDPQDESEFDMSRLRWADRSKKHHRAMLDFFRELIVVRRELGDIRSLKRADFSVTVDNDRRILVMRRAIPKGRAMLMFNFGDTPTVPQVGLIAGAWRKILDSSEKAWGGPGPDSPDLLKPGENITLRPFNASVYFIKGKR